jgi:hypothetical protein
MSLKLSMLQGMSGSERRSLTTRSAPGRERLSSSLVQHYAQSNKRVDIIKHPSYLAVEVDTLARSQ